METERREADEERVLRYEVATRETLERLAHAHLPGIPAEGPVGREVFRDVAYDTADGSLERRGAAAQIRHLADGGRRLEVEVPGAGEGGAVRRAAVTVLRGESAELFAGLSEPAHLLRALVDPALLAPRMALETDRTTRHGEGGIALSCDAVTLRAGTVTVPLHEVEVRLPPGADAPAHAALLRELVEDFGLRPVLVPPLVRARERLAQLQLDELEDEVRAAVCVAVVLRAGGQIALWRRGETLQVPTGPGRGEEAARRVLRSCFEDAAGRLRRLATAPGSPDRPAVEVWLAEELPPEGDGRGDGDGTLVWIGRDDLFAAVGSPALRDAPTLAALHVLARVALADGDDVPPARPDPDALARLVLGTGAATQVDPRELPPGTLLNMELSVLAFNRRVLELAEDPEAPLFERLRFLSIFSANLDEFFRVRVAAFKRQLALGSDKRTMDGVSPREQLDAIGVRTRRLMSRVYRLLFRELLPALERHGVRLLRWSELDPDERKALSERYREEIHPVLTPMAAGPGHPFPHVRNLRPALAARVREPTSGLEHVVVVELPGGVPRFLPLERAGRFVPVEEVIHAHLGTLYPGMQVEEAHTFRVTRNAELFINRRHAADLLEAVEAEVRQRPFRPVVRLEVQRAMPEEMRAFLLRELQYEDRTDPAPLGEEDLFAVEWLVDLRALREIAALPGEGLHFPPFEPRPVVRPGRPLFDVLRDGEILVQFPQDSFEDTVERFVIEAADDPHTLAIKLALYRTDRSSGIVEALRRASAHGKQVVALVELTARFDEQHNIEWARYLRAAGIHVVYGLPGLKCHAKVALVVRREGDKVRRYQYVGTGNLNAATATAYTDLGLLSADPALGEDLHELFNVLTGYAPPPEYRAVLAAPHNMRQRFVEMIGREAEHARAGRGGLVRAKFNGLADREMIAALYRASQAGARIELIVRGICALRPGVPGLSENIRVISILGRFLEHARIFHFGNAGEPEYFIGSADWRTRNLSRRVEVAAPVRDPEHRARLDAILEEQLARPDAWELGSDGTYYRRPDPAPHAPPRPAGESGRLAFVTRDG